MNKAIRGHSFGATMAMVLLAALLLLLASVLAVQLATTTGDLHGVPAISADRDGGSSLARDPAIERHAEIVALYNQDN